ncbi:MAG: 4Fe-4S dicluster domain-containing protein [Candidatus Lokiarchaeota archaeon]|nr:4Fe-4S dicluster domain-containing protein [Candidatus Lokiarchaeota archaeon]
MPIDPDFKNNRIIQGQHKGHAVWGPIDPPEKLGIHGTTVAVDLDICYGCLKCIRACNVDVFKVFQTPGHPVSKTKVDPVNEKACFFCLSCEMVCPVEAIKIENKTTGDTLGALLNY